PTVIHPGAPDRIFLGAVENGPTSWKGHRTVRAGPYNTIRFSRDTSQETGGAHTQILRSDDGGKSWQRLNGSLPAGYAHMTCGFATHPEDANTIVSVITTGQSMRATTAGRIGGSSNCRRPSFMEYV